ncbi:MAG TPA: penicillin-binding protein activator [Stellaceae bacterium]|nr:penicillin-binding protein activator [Stellaceae bacterium]
MLHGRLLRFASTLAAFALLLVLAACGGRMVPAPFGPPQPPSAAPRVPPPIQPEPLPPPAAGQIKIGVLLPLSGPNAELGKAMLEAAQLALFATAGEKLTLVPRDTAGSGGAAAAARSAVADGATLILGPLLAAEVEAVRPIAAEARVNVIAFATQTQVAGGNIFLMGFLPRQEVAREVSFARERGLNRFGALAPSTPYGRLMTDALRDTVGSAGGTVTKVEHLNPNGTDTEAAVKRLVPGAGPEAKVEFDALLLPLGGEQLKQAARQIKAAGGGADKVQLLGSGLWDDPSIAGEPALYGGWFAASPLEQRREFENRFRATYGRPPPRLASLAFDAAALAAALSKRDRDPFSREAILNPSGFTGVDGLFRFTNQGLVQRGLAVLEVTPQGTKVISPAPQTFRDLAF